MEKLKIFTPIAVYGILIGIIYSFAFWDRFSINPLQFASALDIAKVAALPLAAGGLLSLTQIFLSGAADEDWKQFTHTDFTLTSVPRWLKLALKILWDGGITLLLGWLVFYVSMPVRWFGIGICVLILVSGSIERQTLIREFIPNVRLRVAAVYLGVIAPFIAVGSGALAGDTIKSGKGTFILDSDHSSLPAALNNSTSRVFVGTLGNFYVFYSDDQTVSMVKVGDGQVIALKRNPAASSRSYYY
jgi:hypothetical protein